VPNVGFPFGWNVNIRSGTTPSQPGGNKISGGANTPWVSQPFDSALYPTHASLFSQPFVSRDTPPCSMYGLGGIHSYGPTYVYGSTPSTCMYGPRTSHVSEALLSLVLNNLGEITLSKIFTPLETITWGDFQVLLVPTMLHHLPKIHFSIHVFLSWNIGLT
jgi:hypothetical protein